MVGAAFDSLSIHSSDKTEIQTKHEEQCFGSSSRCCHCLLGHHLEVDTRWFLGVAKKREAGDGHEDCDADEWVV